MHYRDIRYSIRARLERGQWVVAVHISDDNVIEKIIFGPRAIADKMARSLIDKWRGPASPDVVE